MGFYPGDCPWAPGDSGLPPSEDETVSMLCYPPGYEETQFPISSGSLAVSLWYGPFPCPAGAFFECEENNSSIILVSHLTCATAVCMTQVGTVVGTDMSSDPTDISLGWTGSLMSGVSQTPVFTQAPCWIRFDHRASPRNVFHILIWLVSQVPNEANNLPAPPDAPTSQKKHTSQGWGGGSASECEGLDQPSGW